MHTTVLVEMILKLTIDCKEEEEEEEEEKRKH